MDLAASGQGGGEFLPLPAPGSLRVKKLWKMLIFSK